MCHFEKGIHSQTKPVFLKQEEKIKITGLLQLVVWSTSCMQNVKNKTKNLKTCKSEDFIQERASTYFFFFCRPHFHGPCASGLQSSWEESQVLSCSLIHICQGLGLTDEGSSSLISPWYGLGILERAEVCFLQTHTELKSSKFSHCKRGSLKRSLS